MEHINWHLLPAEELDKKVDEYLAGNGDISDEVAQQILLRHAELVKRGAISPTEGYLARKKAAQRVMVPNTNFLKQVLKQTMGSAASESRSDAHQHQRKRARSASDSEEERAAKRIKRDEHNEREHETSDEVRMGPQPARVMRGRGSSGASVLDAVFGSADKKKHKDKKRDKKEKKKHKKHKDKRDKKRDKKRH